MKEQTKVLLDQFLKLGTKEQNAFKSMIFDLKAKKQGKRTYSTGSIRVISKSKRSYLLRYKRLNKVIYTETQAEANRQLKEWVTEVDSSKYTHIGNLTLGQYINYYLNEYVVTRGIAPSTKKNYQSVLLPNTKEIADIPLQDIKSEVMTKFFAQKEIQGMKKPFLKQLITILKAVFNVAVDEDKISKNPIRTSTVKTIHLDKEDRPAWTPGEWKIFINGARESYPYLVDLYQLMACLAIGSAEALGLQWGDIDFNKRTYSISRNRTNFGIGETKNIYRNRKLPLSDFAFKILTEVKEQQETWAIAGAWKDKTVVPGSPECSVFTLRDGTEIYPNRPTIAFTKIRKANKLPSFTLHKVRKLFASWAQEQGASTFETARMLGHSTPVTTEQHYTSISDERMREVSNMVGDQLEQLQ